jgi:hypothetical protein
MKAYLKNLFRVFCEPSMLTNSFWRHDVVYPITSYFNPKQKWLTREIPNTWCDKVELVPRLLFACIINFVEKEDGLSQLDIDWKEELENGHVSQEYVDDVIKTYTELLNVYDYVKTERALLQKQHDESYPDYPLPPELEGKGYHEVYAETNRLEKLIEEKDQWAMHTIVTRVGYLWT